MASGDFSRSDWFGASGYAGNVDDLSGPREYAEHLVSYLRDDSTVRARVADRFGCRLPMAEIAALRQQVDQWRAQRASNTKIGEPQNSDAFDFRVSDRPFYSGSERRILREQLAEVPEREVAVTVAPLFRSMTVAEVLAAIGKRGGATPAEIVSKVRDGRIMRVRCLAYAVLRARGNSWPVVARIMHRDHATCMHGARQFFDRWFRDPDMQDAWRELAPCIVGIANNFAEFHALAPASRI